MRIVLVLQMTDIMIGLVTKAVNVRVTLLVNEWICYIVSA